MDVPNTGLKPPSPKLASAPRAWASTTYSSMILPNTNLGHNSNIPLPPSPPDVLKSSSSYDTSTFLGTAGGTAADDFSSRAADLEYSSISNLLGAMSSDLSDLFAPESNFGLGGPNGQATGNPEQQPISPVSSFAPSANSTNIATPPNSDYSPTASSSTYSAPAATTTRTQVPPPAELPNLNSPHTRPYDQPQPTPLPSFPTLEATPSETAPRIQMTAPPQLAPVTGLFTQSVYDTPEEVYSKVTSPYPYTKGYHALIAYLKQRFAKPQLMVLAKSMAAYRPSFIATTKTLQEDDLIFMEKCFQRTLLEFQKFITSSGTPTVVWRRTGQIAAAGREFCILTGWEHQDLVRSQDPRFIMELMDDDSVTRYFDVFTTLAFGDSRGVIMTECTLLRPTGERIKTACTWTVKRDVFDIPMMIVGNFLPILD